MGNLTQWSVVSEQCVVNFEWSARSGRSTLNFDFEWSVVSGQLCLNGEWSFVRCLQLSEWQECGRASLSIDSLDFLFPSFSNISISEFITGISYCTSSFN